MLKVTRRQFEKGYTLFTALRQCWTVPRCQTTSGYMTVLFTSIGRTGFEAPTLDNVDLLFALVITSGFYLHHVEVADQHPATDSL